MKKITAILGKSHNDFDHQLKDLLNDMSDVIQYILVEQQKLADYQNKIFQKQHAEILHTSLCELCSHKADIITTNLNDGSYKSYCNSCLTNP